MSLANNRSKRFGQETSLSTYVWKQDHVIPECIDLSILFFFWNESLQKFYWLRPAEYDAVCYCLSCCRWLTVRLEICGSLILLFASLVMVYYHEQFQGHGEKVGLILTYSLSVTMMLNSIINSQMEISLVSVERLLEYISLPSEVFLR